MLFIAAILAFFLVSSSDICESDDAFKVFKELSLSLLISLTDSVFTAVIADIEFVLLLFISFRCFFALSRSSFSLPSVICTISETALLSTIDSNALARYAS
ncbi:hypothetical protein Wcon_01053 [Wolbachia endosymbiont of Cylisticus convexus]|nr:hypothetical protein Wcon_01603 [Wolbachia endosymbiont of Cylisticus convexus]RDD34812.1 hypothetical protein Wcon_01053 [Wolbachia endosymbiont of Cylisticus convexus]